MSRSLRQLVTQPLCGGIDLRIWIGRVISRVAASCAATLVWCDVGAQHPQGPSPQSTKVVLSSQLGSVNSYDHAIRIQVSVSGQAYFNKDHKLVLGEYLTILSAVRSDTIRVSFEALLDDLTNLTHAADSAANTRLLVLAVDRRDAEKCKVSQSATAAGSVANSDHSHVILSLEQGQRFRDLLSEGIKTSRWLAPRVSQFNAYKSR